MVGVEFIMAQDIGLRLLGCIIIRRIITIIRCIATIIVVAISGQLLPVASSVMSFPLR
jgi:hypothetical protein